MSYKLLCSKCLQPSLTMAQSHRAPLGLHFRVNDDFIYIYKINILCKTFQDILYINQHG